MNTLIKVADNIIIGKQNSSRQGTHLGNTYFFPFIYFKQDSKEDDKIEEKEENKEEIDIDLNDPETEKAALKIQAGFKGFQTRKELKEKKDATEKTAEAPKEEEKKEEEVDIDLNDPEVEKAATKIQAGFKGYKTRKEMKDKKDSGTEAEQAEKPEGESEEKKEGEEEIDIDLNDPEVAKAATKIQAGFKGFKTRQELSKNKGSGEAQEDDKQDNKEDDKQDDKQEGD